MGRRAGLSTEAVIDAAALLADELGFEHLTITALAAQLDVKPPSLYNHVDGLDEIRLALALRAADEICTRLEDAGRDQDPEEAVRAMCHAYRGFARDHPGLYEAHNRGTRLTDDPDDLLTLRRPVPLVAAELAAFGLDGDDAQHAMRAFRGTVQGFLQLEWEAAFQADQSVDESFDRAVDLFVAGIRAWR